MNQGRIWCVVSPNVGLPLLLGSVTLIALGVHASVMTHTTWFSSYWQGGSKTKVSSNDTMSPLASAAPKADSAYVISVAPVAATPGKAETSFVITVAPNPAAATVNAAAAADTPPPAAKSVAVAAVNPQ
jgi:light-harvesting protein B-800-850 alpha chain